MTGVGGTYLCTDPVTGMGVDNTVDPPVNCQGQPKNREVGWIDSGGGFSHVFATPSYQASLPAGSTPIGSMRGVPDVAYQASSRTGVLVYATCDGSGGWYLVGGTSSSSPVGGTRGDRRPDRRSWARADQSDAVHAGLGPNYGSYFYDVTTGNNQADPSVTGYPATTGWDPVTGLGTPNAANLVPALAAG